MRVLSIALVISACLYGADDRFLHWSAKQARSIALAQRVNGQVGKTLDFRGVHTERSYNYKLRATWISAEVIRAVARLEQLTNGLSDEETRGLVAEAEVAGDVIIQVEIGAREGSGVIPNGWSARLAAHPATSASDGGARGINSPKLRDIRALVGVARRDYAYDVFWVVFPLRSEKGEPLFKPGQDQAELSVRIYDKVGKVHWTIPASVRERLRGGG